MMIRISCAALALAAVVVSQAQTVLYQTGFEDDGIHWGVGTDVVGQDGWYSSAFGEGLLIVSDAQSKSGSQSAWLDLGNVSGNPAALFFRPVNFEAQSTDVLVGRVSFLMDNPIGGPFQFTVEGISEHINTRFGGLMFDQSGNVHLLNGSDYEYSDTSLVWNEWNTVELRFDFSTRESSVFLNNYLLGTGNFEEIGSSVFSDLELGFRAMDGSEISGSIFFDDYSVSVQGVQAEPIPEPFTMTLGAAALGLAAARKRRRKS